MTFVDPPDPPEAGGDRLNAKNLKGAYLVLLPKEMGEWPAKPEERDDLGNVVRKASKAQPFVSCDVWVFDRAGVTDQGTDVRFTWWRAVEQLRGQLGEYVACRPMEQEDRSVILVRLSGDAREAAAKIVNEIRSGEHAQQVPVEQPYDEYPPGEEPF